MRKGPLAAMATMTMLLPLVGAAAEGPVAKEPAVPADFLEYLAAFEGDDVDWTDFEGSDASPVGKSSKPAADSPAKDEKPQ